MHRAMESPQAIIVVKRSMHTERASNLVVYVGALGIRPRARLDVAAGTSKAHIPGEMNGYQADFWHYHSAFWMGWFTLV